MRSHLGQTHFFQNKSLCAEFNDARYYRVSAGFDETLYTNPRGLVVYIHDCITYGIYTELLDYSGCYSYCNSLDMIGYIFFGKIANQGYSSVIVFPEPLEQVPSSR